MTQGTFIVVGGPAGTGKTTISEMLSKQLRCPFIEGDNLHPEENIAKMSRGEALTDRDRWGWLAEISRVTSDECLDERNETHVAVVSCSMLKASYRKYLKQHSHGSLKFRFIFLYTTFEELYKRVGQRNGHFMKNDMVKSQYDIMEIPRRGELVENHGDCLAIDTTGKDPQAIFKEILMKLS